ncbi:Solute carrier family 35 member F6-like isoform X1 [Oopsacas minuta]|uniref:Solute carrier family 35 member F6-like isoform X1 n=1 Tax=Oopsacas minuta TaxID=111878 RepID=A0AAV7JTR7_9METZ|nr:Solute carrier family 35 member F6-like isoform X1 [Oopsacas minuta]
MSEFQMKNFGFLIFQLIISFVMVLTGTINTLSTKAADLLIVRGNNPHAAHHFDHPYVQAVGMFIGEFSCMLVFAIFALGFFLVKRTIKPLIPKSFNPLIFLPPACCDILATSTMYLGLNLTSASSFQMLRGAVIIFSGLLSVGFLGSHITGTQWLGMITVFFGLMVVGVGDLVINGIGTESASQVITGDLLILVAQIIVSIQVVVEEYFIKGYQVDPLLAVGFEGMFGLGITLTLLVPMYFIPWHIPGTEFWQEFPRYEDSLDALSQIGNSWLLVVFVLGNIISIAFFNFTGLTVTKYLNATTRMVLDSVRTLFIWLFSLAIMWQGFYFTQLIGFVLLIVGAFIYYDILIPPGIRWIYRKVPGRSPKPRLMTGTFPDEVENSDERDALMGKGREDIN